MLLNERKLAKQKFNSNNNNNISNDVDEAFDLA